MMMKKLLFSSLFLFGSLVSQAQHEYTIEGKVEGVKDGTLVSLFLLDGNVGSTVAMDTIQNGTFFFKRNAGEDGLDKLSLMCTRNDDFPSMSLEIYATPKARIKVTGTNTLIHTWTVDSPVKEQIEYNRFIEDSHDLWDEYQRLSIKARSLRSAPEGERKALRAKEDSISALISKREMKLMQELPVSNIWMDRLYKLSMSVKYNPNFSYKDETLALYNRMNEAQKTSITGQEIAVNLFPPTVVKEGDKMADTELFDLDGKIHHLTDFNGKYILLDFWSSGCGPCIMALPEMKEIQEQYKERLTIISLSSDTKSRWKAASAKHEMTWQNLSDLKQTAGLYADIMTDSMKEAITETERRRKIQKEYNAYNHIDPKSIIKEIAEDLINLDYGIEEKKFENDKKVFRNKTDIEKEITKLEKKIKKLVEELDFEQAIVLRDEMLKLKELLLEF